MLSSRATVAAAFLALVSGGCSSNPGSQAAGASPAKAYKELMAYDWSVGPGVETDFCIYKTASEDTWISDFRPLSPVGTHHVSLGFADPGPPDGVLASADTSTCTGVTLGNNLAFVGTVGTDALSMPEGVAVKIPAGKQMLLSLHLLNPTSSTLTGRSGVEAVSADPSRVTHPAELIFAMTQSLTVPPGKSTQTGTCTMTDDVTLFAVMPHMHLTGVHMTTVAMPATGNPITLLDQDYNFQQQRYSLLSPAVPLHKGDKMQVTCSFDNHGATTLTFGESTTKNEMCITATYRYPAVAASLACEQ